MAVEGRPATQLLTYKGAAYSFQVTGRADTREVRLKVGDQTYAYGPSADGGLDVKGLPATASIPSHLAKGDYTSRFSRSIPSSRMSSSWLCPDHRRRRLPESQHLGDRRTALSAERPPKGPRLHPLLLRHQPGFVPGAIACGWLGQTHRAVGRLWRCWRRHGPGLARLCAGQAPAGRQG